MAKQQAADALAQGVGRYGKEAVSEEMALPMESRARTFVGRPENAYEVS
jgi:hypothetical protein